MARLEKHLLRNFTRQADSWLHSLEVLERLHQIGGDMLLS